MLRPRRRRPGDRWRIRLSRNNRPQDYDLATVILTAWAGPAASPEQYARHIDGNFDNNSPGNLRWAHRYEHEAEEAA